MIDKNPFSDSWSTIAYAVGLAVLGGIVKYVNNNPGFKWWTFIRDLVTAGFCGLLTLWFCEWTNIGGPLMAIIIAASGLMGTRLLKEVETFARIRLGLEQTSPLMDAAAEQAKKSMEATSGAASGAKGE
jgi:hypothetical protein